MFWDQKAKAVDEASPELAPLVAWLAAGEKVYFLLPYFLLTYLLLPNLLPLSY